MKYLNMDTLEDYEKFLKGQYQITDRKEGDLTYELGSNPAFRSSKRPAYSADDEASIKLAGEDYITDIREDVKDEAHKQLQRYGHMTALFLKQVFLAAEEQDKTLSLDMKGHTKRFKENYNLDKLVNCDFKELESKKLSSLGGGMNDSLYKQHGKSAARAKNLTLSATQAKEQLDIALKEQTALKNEYLKLKEEKSKYMNGQLDAYYAGENPDARKTMQFGELKAELQKLNKMLRR